MLDLSVRRRQAAQTILDAGRILQRRRAARAGLLSFAQWTFPAYERVPHLEALAERLERLARREITRLMVFTPPRHGKTELTSIRFPAWYLGHHPQHQIIGCSYAESLAYSNSWAVRQVIAASSYQTLWPTTFEKEGATHWQIAGKENQRASYIAAGVGGGITGTGCNLLVLDDPLKSQEEAESPLIREKIWQWYVNVARTRLEPAACICLIMTRWHQDDLAGRLLAQAAADPDADQWTVLHLRAFEGGKALWPERYDEASLLNIRASIGSRAFTALYQGEPSAAEGNVFRREWLRYYTMRPVFKRLIQSWDTAFKEKQTSDYSVCQLWGEADNGYYLVDQWRARAEFPELVAVFKAVYNRDHPQAVLVEDAASGQSLIQAIRKETAIPVLPVKVDRDKMARANAVTPLFESGRVFFPESAPWLMDYIEELASFPSAEHDDQVDSTTQSLLYLTRSSPVASVDDTGRQLRSVVFSGLRGKAF